MSGRARVAVALIPIQLLVTLWLIVAFLQRVVLLERVGRDEFVSFDDATAVDNALRTANVVWLVSLAVAAIGWLLWQHSAHRWVATIDEGKHGFSPRWGVGCWFVPFANLVLPYQAVREIWLAGGVRATRWTTRVWWAAFLAHVLLSRISVGMVDRRSSAPRYLAHDGVEIVSLVCWIVAGILAIHIVRSIDARRADLTLPDAPRSRPIPARPDAPLPAG